MSAIYKGNKLITRLIRVTPQRSQKKVISTLLDGTDHVQIIGQGVNRIKIQTYVTNINDRNLIDQVDSEGGLLTVLDEEGNYYDGRILEKEEWEKLAKGVYKTDLVISVEVV